MSVRNTVGRNQPDASSVKVTTARFDRFSRGFSREVRAADRAELHVRTNVRDGAHAQVAANMPPVKNSVIVPGIPASAVTR